MFSSRLGFALALAALGMGDHMAHAQSTGPLSYWTPGWPVGFGGATAAGTSANTYGNFPSFESGDRNDGFSYTRYNFPNGFFVGSERGMAYGMSGFSQNAAFGSLSTESMQFGYNFQNAPLAVYGGFNTFKYNSGFGGPLSSFDGTSATVPGYSMNAGVQFKPASNLSLSLGASFTQSGRAATDSTLPSLSNTSQFDLVGGRR